MTYHQTNPMMIAQVMALVTPDLNVAKSAEDLKQRLARFGYGMRDTLKGRVLTTLPHGLEIAPLPGHNT